MSFKLGKTTLTNTDKHLLELLRIASGVRVESLVKYTYPESRQPEKKAATYTKRLRRLQRFGMVRDVNGVWMLDKGAHDGQV